MTEPPSSSSSGKPSDSSSSSSSSSSSAGGASGSESGSGPRRRGKRGGRRRRRKQQSRQPNEQQQQSQQEQGDKPAAPQQQPSRDAEPKKGSSSERASAAGGSEEKKDPQEEGGAAKKPRVTRYRPDSRRYERVRRDRDPDDKKKDADSAAKEPKVVRTPPGSADHDDDAPPPDAKPLHDKDEPKPDQLPSPEAQAAAELVHPTPTREQEYLWGKPGSLRDPLAGLPAAIAAVGALVAGAIAMQLQFYPLIPFVAIGVLCICNWEYRWARSIWYVTLVTYMLWLASVTIGVWFPFFLALIFAYITSPVVDATARLVRSRIVATLIFFAGLLAVILLFMGFAYGELSETVQKIRKQVETPEVLHENLHRLISPIGEQFDVESDQIDQFTETAAKTITNALNQANDMSEDSVEGLIGWASATIGWVGAILLNLLLFLVATFYLLLDWPRLSGKLDSYFSPKQGERLSKLSREIGQILRQYVQGHTVVILLVGLIFYILLAIFGHPHALLLGMVMGILGLIPFLGPIFAGLIAIAVTLTVPVDTGYYLIITVICYAAAQAANDFALYPNIAGRSVSVNPVVALLVLFLIGYGFGILGMFFAVPLVAISRAVIRWMNEEHLPGFEWLKLLRPYEVRHERTLKLQRDQMRALRESQRAAAVNPDDEKGRG